MRDQHVHEYIDIYIWSIREKKSFNILMRTPLKMNSSYSNWKDLTLQRINIALGINVKMRMSKRVKESNIVRVDEEESLKMNLFSENQQFKIFG